MKAAALLGAALLLAAGAARAAPPARDPDWPCTQIKMPTLSIGAVWTGPPVDPYFATWSNDAAVAALAQQIAQRRLPIAEAERAIRAFAAAAGAEKQAKLLALAAGIFNILDAQRGQVIAGLDRFGRRQKQLAAQIRGDMEKLRNAEAAADAAAPPQDLSDRLEWETRLFQQRQQAMSYACDVPNLIEQRLYALTRSIQATLD
jgi:hypothetical protein